MFMLPISKPEKDATLTDVIIGAATGIAIISLLLGAAALGIVIGIVMLARHFILN